ncbi:MAG: GNAT family N-acetyltransferase [Pseudomonadota bacterium]
MSTDKAFNFQPELTGKIMQLRALQQPDFEALYACASDPLVWAGHPSKDRYQRPNFEKWFESALEPPGTLIAVERDKPKEIGSSRYYQFDTEAREVAIGYTFIAREYWGGEVNGELKKLMLDYAFQTVDTVWFHIGPDNIRSQRAIHKMGAVYSHEEIKKLSGGEETYMCFKIHKADWLEAGEKS